MSEPVDFDTAWAALPTRARVAVVTLVAEQAAIDHGMQAEVKAIDHGWMVVEGISGAELLIDADRFALLTRSSDLSVPPGFVESVAALLDEPSSDAPACAFLGGCDRHDVEVAVMTVHDALADGTDLAPVALRHEFRRRRD